MWKKVELTICNSKGDPVDTVTTMANCMCDDCGQEIQPYMMTDRTWEEIKMKDDKDSLVLCFHCFSVRIDRQIFPSDFMECDANEPYMTWARDFIFRNTYDVGMDAAKETKSSGPMAAPG